MTNTFGRFPPFICGFKSDPVKASPSWSNHHRMERRMKNEESGVLDPFIGSGLQPSFSVRTVSRGVGLDWYGCRALLLSCLRVQAGQGWSNQFAGVSDQMTADFRSQISDLKFQMGLPPRRRCQSDLVKAGKADLGREARGRGREGKIGRKGRGRWCWGLKLWNLGQSDQVRRSQTSPRMVSRPIANSQSKIGTGKSKTGLDRPLEFGAWCLSGFWCLEFEVSAPVAAAVQLFVCNR